MTINRRARKRPMAEINVVPYIDVMLVLLVIFMVTAPLLSQGVKVDLPKASAQTISPKEKEPMIVSVDAQGNFYLNISPNPTQPIDTATLSKLVTAELQAAQQRPVLVKGDKNIDYGHIVQAMVLLQQAGAPSVGLITDGTEPSPQPSPASGRGSEVSSPASGGGSKISSPAGGGGSKISFPASGREGKIPSPGTPGEG